MRMARAVVVGSLVAVGLLAGVGAQGQSAGKYHAAGIAQAGDIAYPMNSQAPGFVTLDVSVDASGAVQNCDGGARCAATDELRRRTPCRVGNITPAMVDGQGVAGTVRVNVAFNPFNPSGVGLPGESLQPASGGASGRFSTGAVAEGELRDVSAKYGDVGDGGFAGACWGDGKVHGVIVVRGKGALNGTATAAAKTWAFTAATYKGQGGGVGCGGGVCVCIAAGGDEVRRRSAEVKEVEEVKEVRESEKRRPAFIGEFCETE